MEKQTTADGFWNDPDAAQTHMQKLTRLRQAVRPWQELVRRVEDLATLIELAVEEGDSSLQSEIRRELSESARQLEELEIGTVFSGEYDENNAIVSINAGAGGTEACDWVQMLHRMYTRWAERKGYECEVTDTVPGEVAGFKNVTMFVRGPYAYGYLKGEAGVHRLVRISPFDAGKRRHTTFAAVDVIPEVDEEIELEIDPDDLRIETFRSSGAGGQHVNKTDSAVRITHLPTGVVVSCQNERSQHANRRTAMQMLRARLFELMRQQQAEEIAALRGEQTQIAWGNQIRSYTLQPFTLVKDLRTGHETSNASAVLDGEIDEFIRASLQTSAGKG